MIPSLRRGGSATPLTALPHATLTCQRSVCDSVDMSEILSIRLPARERAEWEKAATQARETVAEYVRKAVRQRAQRSVKSPWEKHFGSADVAVPPPTNANVRRAFAARHQPRA